MIRLACENDAEQLVALNEAFNGAGETTPEAVRASLRNNLQEIVVVAQEGAALAGFVCMQLKRSFCYSSLTAEIAEVYVKPGFRRRGLAARMIAFAEDYCSEKHPICAFELLTGAENRAAQALYRSLGYREDRERHFAKRVNG